MQELRQSTAINVKIGPAVNSTGVTPVTNLTVTGADEAEILKNGTTATLAIGGTLSAITNADGWYNMSLTTGDTNTIGPLTVAINDDSLILPIFRDYMVLEQGFFDTKYNSTGSMKASLTGATYTTATTFHATASAFSTFNAATDGVTLTSATYTTVTSFHASVASYSTFNPATTAVSLGAATYTTVTSFHASVASYSTFNPATTGVSLGAATYATVTTFRATGFSTFDPAATGVSLSSATYTTVTSFHASVASYSTFNPATTGVSLGAATYTTITSFLADVGSVTVANGVSLTAAAVDAILDEVVEGTTTLRQALRLGLSVLTGKSSGGGTATLVFRDIGDTKDRISVTVDANGNRTAVGTRDGS